MDLLCALPCAGTVSVLVLSFTVLPSELNGGGPVFQMRKQAWSYVELLARGFIARKGKASVYEPRVLRLPAHPFMPLNCLQATHRAVDGLQNLVCPLLVSLCLPEPAPASSSL